MKYHDFANIMSHTRMSRYFGACEGNSQKTLTLYRRNLQLSQELFTVISCFEVALRNAIDVHYNQVFGPEWLRNAAVPGGIFANKRCSVAAQTINSEVTKLNNQYTHAKLVAELGFGFWRYLFSVYQYRAGGQTLLRIFLARPQSRVSVQYNAAYIFTELARINDLRNRIAHHEPICFRPGHPIRNTVYAREHYLLILQLLQWMQIDATALLYGLDHINAVCHDIDTL